MFYSTCVRSFTYLGVVAGSVHRIVEQHALSDAPTADYHEIDDDPCARIEHGSARVGRRLVASLLHGTLAERALGVLVVGDVDDPTAGRLVGSRDQVLPHDDRTAGRQRADRQDTDRADDAAHRAVSPRPLRMRLRPEVVERRNVLVDLHRRNHGRGWSISGRVTDRARI